MKQKYSKTCETCLWHWPSLTPGEDGVYRCYSRESPFFHERATHKCKHFEKRCVDMRCPEASKEGDACG